MCTFASRHASSVRLSNNVRGNPEACKRAYVAATCRHSRAGASIFVALSGDPLPSFGNLEIPRDRGDSTAHRSRGMNSSRDEADSRRDPPRFRSGFERARRKRKGRYEGIGGSSRFTRSIKSPRVYRSTLACCLTFMCHAGGRERKRERERESGNR